MVDVTFEFKKKTHTKNSVEKLISSLNLSSCLPIGGFFFSFFIIVVEVKCCLEPDTSALFILYHNKTAKNYSKETAFVLY